MLLCSLALPLCTVLLAQGRFSPRTLRRDIDPPLHGHPGRRVNAEPCWQVAGIDKSVMEQRSAIERDTHSQVEGVCSNSSLSPQQSASKFGRFEPKRIRKWKV